MEEDVLRDAVDRAFQAKQLIEHPLYAESFEYARQSYIQGMLSASTPELREQAWRLVHTVDKVQEHFTTILSNGRLADRQISELVKRQRGAA